jgi:nucleotide-binding universal stress UspA family protein
METLTSSPPTEEHTMFRSLMVPLDRSAFAEQALPLALSIAQRADAKLNLVSAHTLYALDDPAGARLPFDPALDMQCRQQEQMYLDATGRRLAVADRVAVRTAVVDGLVSEALLEQVPACKADLIVMTTHGRGPVSRFFLGSVADELIRRALTPVLLVRPGIEHANVVGEPVFENVLVPLDGSEFAERVLPAALEIARLMEARCTLMRVVPTAAARAEAGAYLESRARLARSEGLPVRTLVFCAAHPAEGILAEARALSGNLIALATHGRGGVRRMLLGSVADKVIRGATGPVLVFRPHN